MLARMVLVVFSVSLSLPRFVISAHLGSPLLDYVGDDFSLPYPGLQSSIISVYPEPVDF